MPLPEFTTSLFTNSESLSAADYTRAAKGVTMDGVCSMGMGALQGGVFLSAFAIALGASNYEVGLIATFAALSQLMQFPGLIALKHIKKRRAITFFSAGTSRILWIFIILIPFLFVSKGITFLLQWLLLSMLIGAFAGPSWNSLLRDIIPPEKMGTIFSRRLMLGTVMALVFTLLGGYFVDWWKGSFPKVPLYAYSILFSTGLGLGIAGTIAISRLPEPRMIVDEKEPIAKMLFKPLEDSNFRKLLFFSGSWTFAVNMAGPFFVVYMLNRIGISVFMITLLTVTSQLSNILFFRIWGKAADRFSNKSVLSVSGPLFMLVILAWTFTTMPERYFLTVPLLFLIHFMSGMSTAGVSLSTANIALKLSPKGMAHVYMTVFGLTAAVCGSIAPLIGGVIADFFAARELSFSINWSEPTRQLSVYALNFKALDFLFFFAFLVGLYSLHRLAFVKEEGEVDEMEVIHHLRDELSMPLRTITSIEGLRRMAVLPITAVSRLSHVIQENGNERNKNGRTI